MITAVQANQKESLIDREKAKPTFTGIQPNQQPMENQLESPLNALINEREQLPLDELPELQRESPLNAVINQRDPLTIQEASEQQMEYGLNAQLNGRKRTKVTEAPHQLESPMHALINGHILRRFWNSLRKQNKS